MTHVSLFTGIGGLDLAAEWAGFETILQVERERFPLQVLAKHWPDVPRITDIKEVTGGSVTRPVTVVSGGFPCQPFSTAGKKRGKKDDRYLWPEMLRVIKELQPTWIVAENVENAVRVVLDEILDDLENGGYSAQAYVVSAYCSGAWFKGNRTFIVATANHGSTPMRGNAQFQTDATVDGCWADRRHGTSLIDSRKRWEIEPRPYGVAHGIPRRMDRLRSLGNAVVPQQAYPIFEAIAKAEDLFTLDANPTPAQ